MKTETAPNGPWIVRGTDGNRWGPFDSGITASRWALKKWPGIKQCDDECMVDEHRLGCWDMETLWTPDM